MKVNPCFKLRFFSVDPLKKSYPWYTPYQFAGNTPIQAIDLDGLEEHKVNENLSVFGPYKDEASVNNAIDKVKVGYEKNLQKIDNEKRDKQCTNDTDSCTNSNNESNSQSSSNFKKNDEKKKP